MRVACLSQPVRCNHISGSAWSVQPPSQVGRNSPCRPLNGHSSLVRAVGFEPTLWTPEADFKSAASANSATPAILSSPASARLAPALHLGPFRRPPEANSPRGASYCEHWEFSIRRDFLQGVNKRLISPLRLPVPPGGHAAQHSGRATRRRSDGAGYSRSLASARSFQTSWRSSRPSTPTRNQSQNRMPENAVPSGHSPSSVPKQVTAVPSSATAASNRS